MKFWCTIWEDDDQVSCVYDNAVDAKCRVLDILSQLDEYHGKTRRELAELAESVEWSSHSLGFGLVEIDAQNEEECYEVYI